MYKETLYAKTEQVLENIEENSILRKFYLAGGTALALQLGHRKSIDLDWFAEDYPKHEQIKQAFPNYAPIIMHESHGTIDMVINDVKISFLEYKYPLLEPLIKFEGIEMASIIDIACMKISAISSRGSKKDFVDLYCVMQTTPLSQILEYFHQKFEKVSYQENHILKSLVYFEDAEEDPEPEYLADIAWKGVKKGIENEVRKLIY